MATQLGNISRILIVRRDNIGDLICTTPLIRNLRLQYPDAIIDLLVNSYNQQTVEQHSDIDHVYAYTKAKHRGNDQSLLGVYWQRILLMLKLRRKQYDLAVLAGGAFSHHALKLVSSIKPKTILSTAPKDKTIAQVTYPLPESDDTSMHEVERSLRLLNLLDIKPETVPLSIQANPSTVAKLKASLQTTEYQPSHLTIGIHISTRKPSQRWPENNFIELIQALHKQYHCQFLLFWAPGDKDNPRHPGDDQKAKYMLEQLDALPVFPIHTSELRELIAGVSLCNQFICSDGGAMHIAAGLGKPIVCFFGDSNAAQWHPWGVPYQLLQPDSKEVSDISIDDALEAFNRLQKSQGS